MADFVIHTTRCDQHGHPEFRIAYNSDLVGEDDIRFLLGALEGAVAAGERYQDGSVFQIGWVLNRLRGTAEGELSVQEPDMVHSPVWWIDSVNHSLIHRRLQQGVCRSLLGVDGVQFPSTGQVALICDRFGDSGIFVMRREDTMADHSGWVLECGAEDHDHSDPAGYIQVPLFEVAVSYEPRVIPYLALPNGMTVSIDFGGPAFRRGRQPIHVRPGSLVDRNFPDRGV